MSEEKGHSMSSSSITAHSLLWSRLDWNLLRVFHEIVRHGGVSSAARARSRVLSRLPLWRGAAPGWAGGGAVGHPRPQGCIC